MVEHPAVQPFALGAEFLHVPEHRDTLAFTRHRRKSVERYSATLGEEWEELPPMFCSSSEKGTGREEILSFIEKCL